MLGLKIIFNKVAKHFNIEEYEIVQKNDAKGEGFMGIVNFIDLKGMQQGKEVNIPLVVKTAHTDTTARATLDVRHAFIIEIHMYTTVLKAFQDFERSFGFQKPQFLTPICYETSQEECKEVLVLQDIKACGFVIHQPSKQLNREHVTLGFKEYAKYHALCYAYKHKYPKKFEEMAKNMNKSFLTDFCHNNEKLVHDKIQQIAEIIKKDNKTLYESLVNYGTNICSKVIDDFKKVDQYSVITHGDAWKNNIMFKYENNETKTPTSAMLIDFQGSMLASPVFDLAYFFLASSDPLLYKSYEEFLKIYYTTLKAQLEENFKIKNPNIFSYDDLLKQWKTSTRFGFVIALFIMQVLLSTNVEDTVSIADGQAGLSDFFSKVTKNEYLDTCIMMITALHESGCMS